MKTASVSSLGASVLVGAQRLTLYHLWGEQNGKWMCTRAACVKVWHPLAVPTSGAPSGSVGSMGTVKRPGVAAQRAAIIGWRTGLTVLAARAGVGLPADLQPSGRGEIAPLPDGS